MNLFKQISEFFKNIFSKNFEIEKEEIDYSFMTSTTTSTSTTTTSTTSTSSTTTTTTTIKPMITINKNTKKHIEDWEGREYSLYDDGAGFGTIGIGHAVFDNNETFKGKKLISSTLNDIEIEELLDQDLAVRLKAEKQIREKIDFELNQDQFDALILFIFNTGTLWNVLANAVNSYNKTKNVNAIKKQWRYYNTSKGKIMAGLINRREGELDLFLGEYKGRNYYNKSKTVNKKLIIGYY